MMAGENKRASAFPMFADVRAYGRENDAICDQRLADAFRRTTFLTEAEEAWYREKLEECRAEFGLRPQEPAAR